MGLTLGHIIYIPVTILIGIVFGWMLGVRHRARDTEVEDPAQKARAVRQAERSARIAGRKLSSDEDLKG